MGNETMTKEQIMALPATIAEHRRKQIENVLLVPGLERKMAERELQAGQQSQVGKNDFERKLQQRSILSNDKEYQTLLTQLDLAKRTAMEEEILYEEGKNTLRALALVAKLYEE